MSRRHRIRLVALGLLTIANAKAIHDQKKIVYNTEEAMREPFNVSEYENRYNH